MEESTTNKEWYQGQRINKDAAKKTVQYAILCWYRNFSPPNTQPRQQSQETAQNAK